MQLHKKCKEQKAKNDNRTITQNEKREKSLINGKITPPKETSLTFRQ